MKNLRILLGLAMVMVLVVASCKKDEVATCSDGIQNGSETGVDCGGQCTDCSTAPSCSDGIQNGDETGVDCGGSICPDCGTEPTCNDGIQNGDETGVDCGGSCPACATCDDGIQNGDETGIDCGGSCPDACPTCSDGIQNGNETGVDCGGDCPACYVCGDDITDIEGNVYGTTELGGLCWTTDNMRTSTYNDGNAISANGWSNYLDEPSNDDVFGKLYTQGVAGSGKLCPEGWHSPTLADWNSLIESQGGVDVAGGPLKSTSSLWNSPNTGATNSSGFSGLPGGYDSIGFGHFDGGYFGWYWSVTDGETGSQSWCVGLNNSDTQAWVQSYPDTWMLSCRCVKD